MAIEESLYYPLIVLGVGSFLSYILIPRFTNHYQEKRRSLEIERETRHKELEIKSDIISKISEITARASVYSRNLSKGTSEITVEQYAEWSTKHLIVTSLIDAYFHDQPIFNHWENFRIGLSSFLYVFYSLGQEKELPETESFEKFKKYVGDDLIDFDKLQPEKKVASEWNLVREKILQDSYKIIREINESKILIL